MPKIPFKDYADELAFQRDVWQRKPVLRELYQHWYKQIVRALAPLKPVIEAGSGCGNFKSYYPECVATDVLKSGPWIDRIVDAHSPPFAAGEAGNIVAFDVIHHLQRPLSFLRQAAAALQPCGRLVLCEPALSPWGRLVYGLAHHEPVDLRWDLFGLDKLPPDPDPGHTFTNLAIAEMLFWRERARTLTAVPQLRLHAASKFAFLLYPLTGGFSYPCFVPHLGFATCLRLEDAAMRPFADWLTGMRMLVVLERRPE